MDFLFKIGIVIIVGTIGGRLARYFKLPNVTGYLVSGLFIGVSVFKVLNPQDIEAFSIISEIALAVIAFSIGSEFELKSMLKVGKDIFIITLAEVVGAILLVFALMYFLFNQDFVFSIVIATMSAATAPAATIMVIRQFRAHGPLTSTILPVVALDDAFGIMAFGIAMSVAKLMTGSATASFLKMVATPFIEIIGSLILGFVLGVILTYMANRAQNQEELLAMVLATIVIGSGLANFLALSPLLTCMMVGATLVNLMEKSTRVFLTVNDFISPIYLMFFTLAGAGLDLKILLTVGALGLGYIIARAGGKMLGASIGAKLVNSDPAIVKYLGLALLPQGGISIGLSMIVRKELPQYSAAITTVILFSVLIYEVSGPIFAKIAIDKAGEINGLDKVKKAA